MSAPRLFSVLRRKAGLIDLITPILPPSSLVEQYRIKTDTNPAGAFVTRVVTAPRTGMVDPDVAGGQHVIQPGENVRMIFKPSNFGLSDNAIWVKLVYVDSAGLELSTPAPSAPTLMLPPVGGPELSGFTVSVPNRASLATALRLDLPRAMENVRLLNLDTGVAIWVAFNEGGPEVKIPFGKELVGFHGTASSLFVRGAGAADVAAVGALTLAGNVVATNTVTIGSKVYTFVSPMVNVDGNVLIGATASDSIDNLIAAINLTPSGAGTLYAAATTLNPSVVAAVAPGDVMGVTALVAGAAGNSIATTATGGIATWGAATLTGGAGTPVDLSVTFTQAFPR